MHLKIKSLSEALSFYYYRQLFYAFIDYLNNHKFIFNVFVL